MSEWIIGIDPGVSGGALGAFNKELNEWSFIHGSSNYFQISDWIQDLRGSGKVEQAYIEYVKGFPGVRKSSAVTLAESIGVIKTSLAACGVGVLQVTAVKWQTNLRVKRPKGVNASVGSNKVLKKMVADAVIQQHPKLAEYVYGPRKGINDGISDAAGIIIYALQN